MFPVYSPLSTALLTTYQAVDCSAKHPPADVRDCVDELCREYRAIPSMGQGQLAFDQHQESRVPAQVGGQVAG